MHKKIRKIQVSRMHNEDFIKGVNLKRKWLNSTPAFSLIYLFSTECLMHHFFSYQEHNVNSVA